MYLINKEDYLALRAFNFAHHRFQALFELPAIFCARNKKPKIKLYQFFSAQGFGYVAGSKALRQSFGNGCFPDTRFTDENWVILGPAGEYLYDARYFSVPSDHGIEFVFPGAVGEGACETGKCAGFLRLVYIPYLPFFYIREHARESRSVDTEARYRIGGGARMFGNTQKQMFRRNELVVETCSYTRSGFKDLNELRRKIQLKRGRDGVPSSASLYLFQNRIREMSHIRVDLLQHRKNHGFFLSQKRRQQVESRNLIMSALNRQLMRAVHCLLRLSRVVVEGYHTAAIIHSPSLFGKSSSVFVRRLALFEQSR